MVDERTESKTWLAVLVSLCLAILVYGTLYSDNDIANVGYLIGRYFVFALILWAVFRALFLHKRGRATSFGAFIVLYIALVTGGVLSANRHEHEAVLALSSIGDEIRRISTARTDSDGLPQRIERAPSGAASSSGALGQMERFVKDFLDLFVAQHNDYLLELEAIGWIGILDAQRLQADTSVTESRVIIEQARTIVDKYERRTDELITSGRNRIESLDMSETQKRQMTEGFSRGVQYSSERITAQWRLERDVISEVENIFALLASSKTWVVEGEQILFGDDDELAQFNSHIQAIDELVKQQNQIAQESVGQGLESLNNGLTQ